MPPDTKYLRNRNGIWWIDVSMPKGHGLPLANNRLRMSLGTSNLTIAARIRDTTITPLLATVGRKKMLEEMVRQICAASDEMRAYVAELSAECAREQIAGIQSAVLKAVPLPEMIDGYIKYKSKTKSWKNGSIIKHTGSRNVWAKMFGDRDAQTITRAEVLAARDEMLEYPASYFRRSKANASNIPEKDEKTLSGRTVNGHLDLLSSAYSWAIREGRVACTNPARACAMKLPKSKQKNLPTPAEAEALTSLAKTCRTYGQMEWDNIPKILRYTGCRWAEVAGLHAEDVIKYDGIWCIDVNERHRDLKTDEASIRLIPIADAILPLLLELKRTVVTGRLFPNVGDRQNGNAIGAGLNTKWNAAAKKVGSFSSHCFRVYVNNVFVRYGVDIIDRERLLGHKNHRTQAVYTVEDLSRYKSHVELIEEHERKAAAAAASE